MSVYQALKNGVPYYYGITNDLARRASEHLATKGISLQGIPGLTGLTRSDAKAVEQVLIENSGLGNLLNKINSISPQNPIYNESVTKGSDILNRVGL